MTMYIAPVCSVCDSNTNVEFVKGKEIYPFRPDLFEKNFWKCDCGAYVGCHGNTGEPLGTPADPNTRKLRIQVHKHFDLLWRTGSLTRREAYGKMAETLGISINNCHIGMFTSDRCYKVLDWLKGAGF